jgi:hypothetical protein
MGLLRIIKDFQNISMYIWMEPSRRALSKSRKHFPSFDTQFLELLAEVWSGSTPASNYFQSVYR